jgi:hypothetical protein
MKEAQDSSETSVLTSATRRNNPEDTILHSQRGENLKSYKGKSNSESKLYFTTEVTKRNLTAQQLSKCSRNLDMTTENDDLKYLIFEVSTAVTVKNSVL